MRKIFYILCGALFFSVLSLTSASAQSKAKNKKKKSAGAAKETEKKDIDSLLSTYRFEEAIATIDRKSVV